MRIRAAGARRRSLSFFTVLALASGLSCRRAPQPSAEELVLRRQIQALQSLLGTAASGSILPFEHILVVVDQSLVQDIIEAALPVEGDVGGFHLRIEAAAASFGDGVALLRLKGKVHSAGKSASASMIVYGGIDVVELSRESRLLRGRVSVYGVEVQEADILGVDERGLTRTLTHLGLETLLPFVEVPIRFEDEVVIPAVQADRLRIKEARLPLNARVALIRAFGGKLWVAVEARTGEGHASDGATSAP